MYKVLFIWLPILLVIVPEILAQDNSDIASTRIHPQIKYNIPVPPVNRNTLFYIQKSTNPNTVMYEGNRNDKDNLDEDQPVDVFWIRYQQDSTKKDLNFIQRKLAYGINFDSIEDGSGYWINLVSYKKRKIYIFKNEAGEIQANMEINGKLSRFRSVFIEINKDFFIPEISFIELFGEDLITGTKIYERVVP